MDLQGQLLDAGFDARQAEILACSARFNTDTYPDIGERLDQIGQFYRRTIAAVRKAIADFPPFYNIDHVGKMDEAAGAYGDRERTVPAVFKHAPFIGLDHERVIYDAVEVYRNKARVIDIIWSYPQFAGYDHRNRIDHLGKLYNSRKKVIRATLKFPPFPSYDHERVLRQMHEIYANKKKIRDAILTSPQIVGLDHKRVIRQKTRMGRLVGLPAKKVKVRLIEKPVWAGYSAKRDLAGIDIGLKLVQEGFEPDEKMVDAYFRFLMHSPYVPGTKRKRMSRAVGPEPPMLRVMRASLSR